MPQYFRTSPGIDQGWTRCPTLDQGRTQGGAEGARPPLNGNGLNTNLLLTFVKTQNNSAHAYIAI